MSWDFLTKPLEEIHKHSTTVGKISLTVLVVFRIVLTAIGESIFVDDQRHFVCNTTVPGCENLCYDSFAPLSPFRFFSYQIVLVAIPSLSYLAYVIRLGSENGGDTDGPFLQEAAIAPESSPEVAIAEETLQEVTIIQETLQDAAITPERPEEVNATLIRRKKKRQSVITDTFRIKNNTPLLRRYVLQLLVRSAVEVIFVSLMFALYHVPVPATYQCSGHPCPPSVECYVSRPTEKTVFLAIMCIVSLISLVLNVWEIFYIYVPCRSKK